MVNANTNKPSTIDVKIVSAHSTMFEGKADLVVATTIEGEIGIKPKHIPFLAVLKPGQAIVHDVDGSEEVFYISGGVIEVQPNLVTILADDALRAKDIDEAKAERAKADAVKILSEKNEKLDYARLQVELAQSLAQLRALHRFKKQIEKRR